MIARTLCRLFGHNMKSHGSFNARGHEPARVVLVCGRCSATAVVPAVTRPR